MQNLIGMQHVTHYKIHFYHEKHSSWYVLIFLADPNCLYIFRVWRKILEINSWKIDIR